MERTRSRMSEFVDLVVDLQILFDIRVGTCNVRLGLIIIVIRNEKLDAIVREKLAHLVAKLSRERFVVRHNERGTVYPRDYVSHRKCFSASRNAEKDLRTKPVVYPFDEFFDSLGLIPRRLIRRYEFKLFHTSILYHSFRTFSTVFGQVFIFAGQKRFVCRFLAVFGFEESSKHKNGRFRRKKILFFQPEYFHIIDTSLIKVV